MLGMMVSSILRFAKELGSRHVVKSHAEKRRTQMLEHSTVDENQYRQVQGNLVVDNRTGHHPAISAPSQPQRIDSTFDVKQNSANQGSRRRPIANGLKRLKNAGSRRPKRQLLKEEKDRFDAMRSIERSTHKFKRYSALAMSTLACRLPKAMTYRWLT